MTEIRTTSATGGEKGVKPERHDLIPVKGVAAIARVFGFGAQKYGPCVIGGLSELVSLCSCERQTATRIALTKLEDSASRAMTEIFASATRSTPSASATMRVSGIRSTESASVPTISTIVNRLESDGHYRPSIAGGPSEVSLPRMASAYLLSRVESALSVETTSGPEDQTSITVMLTDLLEGFYAHAATRLWASSVTRKTVFGEHSNTCNIHQAILSSDGTVTDANRNNWRKKYEWGKSLAALNRHIDAFADGETYDPESGLPHLAHAGFHILVLLTWLEEDGEGVENPMDDRWPAALERARIQEGVNKALGSIATLPEEFQPATYPRAECARLAAEQGGVPVEDLRM